MSTHPTLLTLRIGCVQYLNSKPLIHGFHGRVSFDHPSGLARDLATGRLDVALVPTFEALRTPHYTIADGVAIACDGPVYSVFLAHRGPLAELRSVALDPASLTSVHLLQVLLREYHGVNPQRRHLSAFPKEVDAALIIGNQAIEFRQNDKEGYEILDLGEEWKRCTGLPFVFAAWLMRPGLPNTAEVARELRVLKKFGMKYIRDVIITEQRDREFTQRYLTEHIRFELGDREKASIEKYRELLAKHGFIADSQTPLCYA